mgnify:CR=1 FL=1
MRDNFKSRFNWLLEEELAIGIAPQKEEHLLFLKRNGINSILNLCHDKEVDIPKNINETFIYKKFSLTDHKFSELITIEKIKIVLEIIDELIKKGPLFINCKAAVERSPLICMAWLIKKHNLNKLQSLNYLMQKNKGTCPSIKQLKILDDL